MPRQLSIDLETYSSIPIGKAGAQAYVRSPDFEILLFAYSIDDGPVQVIDMAQGEKIPERILGAIESSDYTKRAYNANFEWQCLSQYLGHPLNPSQWVDDMLLGTYAGYPAGLDAVGHALGLSADKQKMTVGKALIRYFCVPCKPTKANGGRTRNLPHHDIEKWNLFKEYNRQDVVTEMAIVEKLGDVTIPSDVQKQWETDLLINNRGVAVDMEFVNGALSLGNTIRNDLLNEAYSLTKLENPNSVSQLRDWLESETGAEVKSLTKADVAELMKRDGNSDKVARMLEIRKELGKTSTKKYDAIETCVCSDSRVRGLLQFYGATRTGRWAGRLVQVQNLPRTYTEPLPLARALVKEENLDGLTLVYGSPNDTLSQLIRTAFVASEGNVLIDADFSAIEARVISWIADEKWRLEVFRNGGDIYCASASQMFHCNVVKGSENGHLRQKGKIAELALGYQGGTGAMIAMGAIDMGIPEDELQEIVTSWRQANKNIVNLWYEIDEKARYVIQNGGAVRARCVTLAREYLPTQQREAMTITLPSGRKLYYISPRVGTNRFGNNSIIYLGLNQETRKWTEIETYGGKLVENIVQAVARDCLALAIERLEANGLPIVFHVHDEVVIDVKRFGTDEEMLNKVVELMTQQVEWTKGLPLNADGWVGEFFKKD